MPRTNTAVSQAVMLLKILRHIPERRLATLTQIQQSLALDDIVINDQALRRNLASLCEDPEFRVTRERQGNVWFYRREALEQTLATPTPESCLLLRLVEEELKWNFPDSLRHELKALFNQSKEFFGENGNSKNRSEYLRKVVYVPLNVRGCLRKVRSDVFSVLAQALYLNQVVKLTIVERYYHQLPCRNESKQIGFFNPIRIVKFKELFLLATPIQKDQCFMLISCSNIKKAELQTQQVVRPSEEMINNYLEDWQEPLYHGVFTITNKKYIKYINSAPACPGQKIEQLENEKYRVDLPYMEIYDRKNLERLYSAVFEKWEKVLRP